MMQECAAKWRSMDDEAKTPYQALADKDKERWLTEKAAEKKPKDQWRPKRPPSAYFLFLKDFRALWKLENDVPEEPEPEEVDPLEAAKIAERLSGSDTPDSGVIDNTTVPAGVPAENGDSTTTDSTTTTTEVNSNTVPNTDTEGSTDIKPPNCPDEENNLKIDESNHEIKSEPIPLNHDPLNDPLTHDPLTHDPLNQDPLNQDLLNDPLNHHPVDPPIPPPYIPPQKKVKKERKTSRVVVSAITSYHAVTSVKTEMCSRLKQCKSS